MAETANGRGERHVRMNHEFAFKQLEYDEPINYSIAHKFTFFFSRRPDTCEEHFFQHYIHVHGDLTVAAEDFGAFEVQRYTQDHQTDVDRAKVKNLGFQLLDYDACSTIWFKSWDHAEAFFKSPNYSKLAADCEHFMQTDIKVMASREALVFGKATPEIHAKDGVTRDQLKSGAAAQKL